MLLGVSFTENLWETCSRFLRESSRFHSRECGNENGRESRAPENEKPSDDVRQEDRQRLMRQHLLQCFEKSILAPFATVGQLHDQVSY